MPIGRRTYFHLEQISFFEFVIETGNEALFKKMSSFSLESRMPESLHQFMAEKRLNSAVRININQPSVENIRVKTNQGIPVSYRLLSLPVYLTERPEDLIEQALYFV